MLRLHATCVALDGLAVLLQGPSGAGKSDLALRLIDRGAVLVADDQVLVRNEGGRLIASAPATIAGRIEVRGLGILRLPALAGAPVCALFELATGPVERLPVRRLRNLEGVDIPWIALNPFECSAGAKVRLAVRAFASDINACPDPASSSAGFVFP